jgi:hypothetical protein
MHLGENAARMGALNKYYIESCGQEVNKEKINIDDA